MSIFTAYRESASDGPAENHDDVPFAQQLDGFETVVFHRVRVAAECRK